MLRSLPFTPWKGIRMKMGWLAAICFPLVLISTAAAQETWPQFRGPAADGHADAANIPLTWSEDQNMVWKTAIPGRGHSSPVVVGHQIWLTTAIDVPLTPEEQKKRLAAVKNPNGLAIADNVSLVALCVDTQSGKIVQQIELFSIPSPEPIHALNSYASPTPIIADGKVYFHFGTYGTAAVDAASGQILWKNDSLKTDHQNGPGSSPALWKDLLLLHFDGIDTQYVVALDKSSGALKWRTDRAGKLEERVDMKKAYCTPTVFHDGQKVQMISPGATWVYSYDPATGDELWRANYGKTGFSTVPRPIIGHGMTYICTSYMESRLLAIRYDGRGDVTKSHIAWTYEKQVPKKPSLLLVGDEIYFVSDSGVVACLDAKTGQEHYRERLGGQYSASPLYANGRIYYFSQEGKTTVIKPGTKYEVLATHEMGDGYMASPAVIGRTVYLRSFSHLYRIEELTR